MTDHRFGFLELIITIIIGTLIVPDNKTYNGLRDEVGE